MLKSVLICVKLDTNNILSQHCICMQPFWNLERVNGCKITLWKLIIMKNELTIINLHEKFKFCK